MAAARAAGGAPRRRSAWRREAAGAVLTLAILLASGGCALRPPRSVRALEEPLAAARAACALEYAPDAYAAAVERVAEAEATGRTWRRLKARRQARLAAEAITAATRRAREVREREMQAALTSLGAAAAATDEAVSRGAAEEALPALEEARELQARARNLFETEDCRLPEARALADRAAARAAEAGRLAADIIARRQEAERGSQEAERMEREQREARSRRARERAAQERVEQIPPLEKARRWVVSQGECLWRIAAQPNVFGDPFQWPLIYWQNKERIEDPDLIFPEQDFLIPFDPSREEIESAIRHARGRVWPTPGYLFDRQ